uniref:NUT family member 2G-like n=1 Tax=Pristiophorus japonicus TaxID=55135 RepID=UPI00398F517A
MDGSTGQMAGQMLADKYPPPGQKVTLVSLDPAKSGVKVQLPGPHRGPPSGLGTVPLASPGVTLTVGPNPQVATNSRALPPAPGGRLEVHDPKTKTVILTSPCIKWIKSGQNFKVINLPLGLVPSLNVCRLPHAKSIVISRPANLNQIIIHKEAPPLPMTPQRRAEGGHRDPGLPVPWRGQVTPIVFSTASSPVVLSISQAAGAGGGGAVREPGASIPVNSGYSRGVYENFRKWQQYKGLVRTNFPLSPDTEAVACFFIPVLRSLSQFKPQLSTEERIPLAIQEWSQLSNFDRMNYYEMAEKFMEFESEEQAQRVQCEQVPVQPGMSQGVQLVSGTTGKPGKQVLEDPGGKKSVSKGGSQRSHKQPKAPAAQTCASSGPGPRDQPIPIEAVNQYIEIMEALSRDQQAEGEALPEPSEEQAGNEPELIKYIEKLCSKDSFISKAEAIIHPEFLSDLLSPQGNIDFPRLIKELEMEEHLSTAELEHRRDCSQAGIGEQTERADPRPQAADPRPQAADPRPASPPVMRAEAARPLQGLLLPPLDPDCPYSSRLQRLALQSACDKAAPPTPPPAADAEAPPFHHLLLLREMKGEASPSQAAEAWRWTEALLPRPAVGPEPGSLGPVAPDDGGSAGAGELEASPEEEQEEEQQALGVLMLETLPLPLPLPVPQASSPGPPTPGTASRPQGDPQPTFLDAGDAYPSPGAPKDSREPGESPSEGREGRKAEAEACPLGPEPRAGAAPPAPAPPDHRPPRSNKNTSGAPRPAPPVPPTRARVRTRQQKRGNDGTVVRRSKRVKKS